ncbi:alanyl-tRNA editing protein [Halorubellus sp. JP-L1]|uniref:alanyl-tRNA editing protein n=1 Tax=Halorubellus sp. JP-L1 TaxID=2715753 RepID=UPI00140E2C43|nr:alanyl-tRNA editing protein [Halorubellus sp. JP-L1]
MTERRYLQDASVREFDATVTAVRGDAVVLDATHFYPTGGGQPHDTGVLRTDDDAYDVVDVDLTDELEHHLDLDGSDDDGGGADADRDDAKLDLAPGDTVVGVVDDARRSAHSRYHTAQHLLSAVLLDEYDARTTGNQLYEDRARLDCEYERFDDDDLDAIESRLSELVAADHPVRWYEMDRDVADAELDTDRTRIDLLPESITELRIVEIGGDGPRGHCEPADAADEPIDRTACAGTHVTGTGEIGDVTVTGRETAGSGEERIRFVLE